METIRDKVSSMNTCQDCGIEYPYLQKAHIVARHKGGTNDKSNIVLICPNCHHLRDRDDRVAWQKRAWTPERKRRQSELMTGRTWSTNPDKSYAASMRAKAQTNSPEAQLKRSESLKKAWETGDWSERNKKLSESMKGNQNGLGNRGPSRIGWGNGLQCCQVCSTSERPHKAKGLCNACYLKIYRGNPV